MAGADLRACLVASWNLGALPPVLLRAVRLVRAMVVVVVVVVLLLGGWLSIVVVCCGVPTVCLELCWRINSAFSPDGRQIQS